MTHQSDAAEDKKDETDDSLIPAISTEEARLQALLEEAKEEGAKLIEDAEREAAERIEKAKQELPAAMADRRKEALLRAEAQAEKERRGAGVEAQQLRERAQGNVSAAVDRIVSLVCLRSEQ